MSRKTKRILIILGVILVLGVVISLPPVWIHIGWRLDNVAILVERWIHPPEKAVFVPSIENTVTPSAPTATEFPTSTPEIPPTPTITPTPLPGQVLLGGIKYVHQHGYFNYCAPANLSMMLSYWKVYDSITTVADVLMPGDPADTYQNVHDKNVMPYELVDYVTQHTNLQALVRVGGNLQTLKNLLANNFVVQVERAVFFPDYVSGKTTWMGHYNVVVGYDDSTQQVIVMDSYIGTPENPKLGQNVRIPYSEFMDSWRAFDYVFLVVYPPEKQNDVLNAIGILADDAAANQEAARMAEAETKTQSGLQLFMAWYNLGTSRVRLFDYMGAKDAYDQAYLVYPEIPEEQRPYRMLWYQTGPYFAYYYTQRYQEVITLADQAIAAATIAPYLEESFYWRAMAEMALGDQSTAIDDMRTALKYHPDFAPAVDAMNLWGIPLH